MSFTVEIWGDYACFSRPELKVERVSYDVITPSAARGILEAIFWKPAIKYVIDEIRVCQPIEFENIRRNEVNSKASPREGTYIYSANDRAQRAAMVLRNVRYVIVAHFEKGILDERDKTEDGTFNHGKFAESITRRLRKGQCYHMPYLGTREFPANVRLLEEDIEIPISISEDRDFGLMLYDMECEGTWVKRKTESDDEIWDYTRTGEFTPTYFWAVMKNGVIDLRNVEVLR